MAVIYGQNYTRNEFMKFIGDISQVADARGGRLTSGKADGMKVIDVKTGSGLEFSVLPSRGMDISWASFQGKPLSYISKTSVVKPEMYEKDGLSFLRSFTCGLVTTCGLTYMGAPCIDNGEALGLHGRISNLPADDVSVLKEWIDNEFIIKIRGKVSESAMFGENFVLTRSITTKLGSKKLEVHDVIENIGYETHPIMLLYHVNFGYPIVSKSTKLIQSWNPHVVARDSEAEKGIANYDSFENPTANYKEQVFFHSLPEDSDAAVCCMFNEEMNFGGYVKFNTHDFSHLSEWKMVGESDYVVGIEPATWLPLGRAEARKRNELEFLKPGQKREFRFEIGVVENKSEIEDLM